MIPVDITAIAKDSAGIDVVADIPKEDGFNEYYFDAATRTIHIRPNQVEGHSRFLIAKSLGEILMGLPVQTSREYVSVLVRIKSREDFLKADLCKRMKNAFASELLMPNAIFLDIVAQNPNITAKDLQEFFLMSETAVKLRLKKNGIELKRRKPRKKKPLPVAAEGHA